MAHTDKTPKHIRLDERDHVEIPFLDQLAGLGWQVIDLEMKQQPGDTFRENFTEVVMLPVLREQLKTINPWLQAVRRLLSGKNPRERSGIIWHTQGSGK